MMSLVHYCFVIFLLACTSSSPIEQTPRADENLYRLPTTVLPESYELTLTLPSDIFQTNRFNGILDLKVTPTVETSEIKLHANELEFSEIKLTTENGVEITLANNGEFPIDSTTDFLTLTTSTSLTPGNVYNIHFSYTGRLRTEDMYGFYRSKYTENGVDKYLATTQFQTTYARRAFPCFDEPSFKATFKITIRHSSTLSALSNTRGTPSGPANGVITTTFEQTPKMSTYLVAFIVSEFTCEQSQTDLLDIPHQICSRENLKSLRGLALDAGPKLLNKLEEFTGIKFSHSTIDKIDQAAIPDFAAGAMENWGLATYRETALLWDENESSNRYKQRVITVIAHELGHMWFGDLVTTHWWSDTFLNEGFATYLEYFITAQVETDWEIDKQFVLEELQPILLSDALQTSQALSHPAASPSEVSSRFGSISYNKGGSVLRMVQNFMGMDKFKEGLNKYLLANAFNNTTPEQLWTALQDSTANLPATLVNVMENWVNKPGYPVLKVENVGSNIAISQERFLTDGGVPDANAKWYVPISYTTSRDSNKFESTVPRKWLLPDQNSATLEDVLKDENDWIILNNQQSGYYRVSYSDDLLKRITTALSQPAFSGIHVLNRAQLVDDMYNLAKAGLRTYTEFLDFLVFLKKDTSYFPWYSALTALSGLLQRTGDEQIQQQLYSYIADLIEVFYNQAPFNDNRDDDQIYTHAKVLALTWGCNIELEDCIQNSLTSFSNYVNNNVKPNKNVRSIVYCNGLRHSSNIDRDWQFLWNKYLETDLATEQVTILTALGCARSNTILTNYLSMSISSTSGIRQQDALSVFSAVYSGNPEGVDIAAEFLYNNHETVASYYGSMNSKTSLINGLTGRFTTEAQIKKLQEFSVIANLDEELKSATETAIKTAEANLKITQKLESQLNQYFTRSSASSLKVGMTMIFTFLPIFYKLLFTV